MSTCCGERLCLEHLKVFKGDLEHIAGVGGGLSLMEDLDITLTKTDAVRPHWGGRNGSDVQPLVFNLGASEAGQEVVRAVHWVARAMVEHYGHLMFPCDTSIRGLARWLLLLPNLVTEHPDVVYMASMIRAAVLHATTVMDRPADRMFLGACRGEVKGARCGASLYAEDGQNHIRCSVCRAWWDVEELREYLLAISGDQLVSIRDAVGIINPLTGVEVSQATIRGWKRRGRIRPAVVPVKGPELYRVGDLVAVIKGEI